MAKPRLRHVAEIAGVSQATVSRVLNDKEGVAEGTRRRVLNALDQLGYEPVGTGRLGPARGGLIGLIVPELTNPIFPAFAESIEMQLAAAGFTTVICTSTPAGRHEEEYVETLLRHGADGFVFLSGRHADSLHPHDHYRQLQASGVPLVLVNGRPDDLPDLPAVAADDLFAARSAVEHLVGLGHRRIGLIVGPRRYVPAQRKVAGYLEALRSAGCEADERFVVSTVYTVEGGHAGALELLDRGVSAVVCASDVMAFGAMRAAVDAGLGVPRDLSVVGFDDSWPAGHVAPPLTTTRQPIARMVHEIVARLRDQAMGRPVEANEFLFRTDLVVRESTGPPGSID